MARLVLVISACLCYAASCSFAQMECPDTLKYCNNYQTLRKGQASLRVNCSQTRIEVSVITQPRLVGGLLEYVCSTSGIKVTCTSILRGVLLMRNQTLTVDLEPNTKCVFFGCYSEFLRFNQHSFDEVACFIQGAAFDSAQPSANDTIPNQY